MIATFSFAIAIRSLGTGAASLMLAVVPGLTAMLAVPLLGESLSHITLVGIVLVTSGALLGARFRHTPTPLTPR